MLRTADKGTTILLEVEFDDLEGPAPTLLDIEEVKKWSKVTHNLEDDLIQSAIDEVIDLVQEELNSTLIPRQVTASYEAFARQVRLPYGPIIEVLQAEQDESEVSPKRIGDTLFFDRPGKNLKVTYQAGYTEVPQGIKLGLKQAILTAISDREDNILGRAGQVNEIPSNSRKRLLKYKRY